MALPFKGGRAFKKTAPHFSQRQGGSFLQLQAKQVKQLPALQF
jgi:hypothetical protein